MSVQVIENIKKIENSVMKQVDVMVGNGISFPANYDPKKAVLNAVSIIKQDSKLMSSDPASIAQSISYMVQLGLEPAAKQCYFIPFGNKVNLMPSYFGTQTILRRIKGVVDITAQVIYEDDDLNYEIESGNIVNLKHETNFKNRKSGIAGAYAVITLDEDIFGRTKHIEIMDMEEIQKAWGQGATKGKSPAHTNFPQEMSKKTVINRACKNFINTITDKESIDLVNTYNIVADEERQPIQTEYTTVEQNVIDHTEPTPEPIEAVTEVVEAIQEQPQENQEWDF